MDIEPDRTRSALASRLLLGVATGLLLGLLMLLSPVIAVVAILAVVGGTVVSVRRADPLRAIQLAGTLIGAGALLVYGVINTVAACAGTDDFCGNANVWPLAALAVVTVGVGAVAAVVAVARSPGKP
jgi:hypothetical protein